MTPREAMLDQAASCRQLGSPFTARLLTLAAERLTDATPVGAHLLAWQGDVSSRGQSVPLRLAGALHRLVLSGSPLAEHWPPHETGDDALWQAVEAAFLARETDILASLGTAPQTNEVARAAALIPALSLLAPEGPLALIELGASAGLNLGLSRFALEAGEVRYGPEAPALTLRPEWTGPAPGPVPMEIASRRGVDLAPVVFSLQDVELRHVALDMGQAPFVSDVLVELHRGLELPSGRVALALTHEDEAFMRHGQHNDRGASTLHLRCMCQHHPFHCMREITTLANL